MNKKEIIEMVLKDAWAQDCFYAFVEDKKIFVTDKRIAFVFENCSSDELRMLEEQRYLKDIIRLLAQKNKSDIKGNFDPKIVEVPIVSCKNCDGTGKIDDEHMCLECDGDGYKHCEHCDNENPCKKCNGTGSVSCGKINCDCCDGTGQGLGPVIVEGVKLSGKYLNILKMFDDCLIEMTPGLDMKWFVFDGGYGAVMPMIETERR